MLSRLRILPRLMVGFGILVLLIAVLGGVAIYSGQASHALFQTVTRLKNAQVVDEQAERQLVLARMLIWQALATNNKDRWQDVSAALDGAHQRLDQLVALTPEPERLAQVRRLQTALAGYEATAFKLKQVEGENTALRSPEAKAVLAAAV